MLIMVGFGWLQVVSNGFSWFAVLLVPIITIK